MATWQCVLNCGACCYLNPVDRPFLDDFLSIEELDLYLGMVDEDGWCINYDRNSRKCQIYEERPRFCRVEVDTFEEMYGITDSEFDEFAINCCLEHIEDRYGNNSQEMKNYRQKVGI